MRRSVSSVTFFTVNEVAVSEPVAKIRASLLRETVYQQLQLAVQIVARKDLDEIDGGSRRPTRGNVFVVPAAGGVPKRLTYHPLRGCGGGLDT